MKYYLQFRILYAFILFRLRLLRPNPSRRPPLYNNRSRPLPHSSSLNPLRLNSSLNLQPRQLHLWPPNLRLNRLNLPARLNPPVAAVVHNKDNLVLAEERRRHAVVPGVERPQLEAVLRRPVAEQLPLPEVAHNRPPLVEAVHSQQPGAVQPRQPVEEALPPQQAGRAEDNRLLVANQLRAVVSPQRVEPRRLGVGRPPPEVVLPPNEVGVEHSRVVNRLNQGNRDNNLRIRW